MDRYVETEPRAAASGLECIMCYEGRRKAVRQSVTLPAGLAKQVGRHGQKSKAEQESNVGRTDRERDRADQRKQDEFFALAECFRNEQDPDAASRLGDELGRMALGG